MQVLNFKFSRIFYISQIYLAQILTASKYPQDEDYEKKKKFKYKCQCILANFNNLVGNVLFLNNTINTGNAISDKRGIIGKLNGHTLILNDINTWTRLPYFDISESIRSDTHTLFLFHFNNKKYKLQLSEISVDSFFCGNININEIIMDEIFIEPNYTQDYPGNQLVSDLYIDKEKYIANLRMILRQILRFQNSNYTSTEILTSNYSNKQLHEPEQFGIYKDINNQYERAGYMSNFLYTDYTQSNIFGERAIQQICPSNMVSPLSSDNNRDIFFNQARDNDPQSSNLETNMPESNPKFRQPNLFFQSNDPEIYPEFQSAPTMNFNSQNQFSKPANSCASNTFEFDRNDLLQIPTPSLFHSSKPSPSTDLIPQCDLLGSSFDHRPFSNLMTVDPSIEEINEKRCEDSHESLETPIVRFQERETTNSNIRPGAIELSEIFLTNPINDQPSNLLGNLRNDAVRPKKSFGINVMAKNSNSCRADLTKGKELVDRKKQSVRLNQELSSKPGSSSGIINMSQNAFGSEETNLSNYITKMQPGISDIRKKLPFIIDITDNEQPIKSNLSIQPERNSAEFIGIEIKDFINDMNNYKKFENLKVISNHLSQITKRAKRNQSSGNLQQKRLGCDKKKIASHQILMERMNTIISSLDLIKVIFYNFENYVYEKEFYWSKTQTKYDDFVSSCENFIAHSSTNYTENQEDINSLNIVYGFLNAVVSAFFRIYMDIRIGNGL
ncbi:hypothetical protein DMUE_0742 [Dictyocoela muelleri]|nr:hypothetical protein DMUE_0742 [Dictyocoela muelleri]